AGHPVGDGGDRSPCLFMGRGAGSSREILQPLSRSTVAGLAHLNLKAHFWFSNSLTCALRTNLTHAQRPSTFRMQDPCPDAVREGRPQPEPLWCDPLNLALILLQ